MQQVVFFCALTKESWESSLEIVATTVLNTVDEVFVPLLRD